MTTTWICTNMPAGGYGNPTHIDNCDMYGFSATPDKNGLIVVPVGAEHDFKIARLPRYTTVYDVVRNNVIEVWFDKNQYRFDSDIVQAALNKKVFKVEHNIGTAGINENADITEIVIADNPIDAITRVAGELEGWNRTDDTIENPDASNCSGGYCDYWFAEELKPFCYYFNTDEDLSDFFDEHKHIASVCYMDSQSISMSGMADSSEIECMNLAYKSA